MGIFNATSTYGGGFKPTGNRNEFYLKVYTGGFAGANTAEEKLKQEINHCLATTEFTTSELISKKFNWFPSYHKFVMLFE
jgi:hypothetical protein